LKKHPFKVVLRFPELTGGSGLKVLQNASGLLSRALNWIRERQSGRSGGRRLKVTETVSLGDKRFIAVVQMDGIQYLVGGGATNVTLLAQLKENEPFQNLLKEALSAPEQHTAEPLIEQLGQQI
jgi:flagellar biogenesis protein FliO